MTRQSTKTEGRKPSGSANGSVLPRWGMHAFTFGLGAVLVLVIQWFATPRFRDPIDDEAGQHSIPVSPQAPWGQLKTIRLTIERPAHFLDGLDGAIPKTRWTFPGMTDDEVRAILSGSGFGEEQVRLLGGSPAWIHATNAVVIEPPLGVLLGLGHETRSRLYAELGKYVQNEAQVYPFMYPRADYSEWLDNAGLSPKTLEMVKQLLYEQGGVLCFADAEVIRELPPGEERRRLIGALSRKPALLVKLQITPKTDTAALAEYWSNPWNKKDIRPMLDSIKRVHGGATLDIVHLLSTFARRRLYTFPEATAAYQDCFWTALNYFSDTPDERLMQPGRWMEVLREDYRLVNDAPRLGDVMLLADEHGGIHHACNYVADNIVFTKNGSSPLSPWVLSRMEDMSAYYTRQGPPHLLHYRKKYLPKT